MDYEKVPQEINNIVGDNVKLLAQLFPSAVKDGQVDFEALKEELGQFEEVDKEKYELTWAGKQDAKKKAREDVYNRTLNYIETDSKNPETTENLYIEGDNLEAMKLLRQNYYGAVKMIYIDPPYNTDGDFVYNDKFKMTTLESDIAEGTRDDEGNPLQKNQQSSNRYHANWLNMMYPRLRIARDLLTDDGVIIINIDEHEVTNLQKVCTEVFEATNELGTIIWDKRNPKGDAKGISYQHEYIILFAKNKEQFLASCKMMRPKKNAEAMIKKSEQIFKKVGGTFSLDDANSEFQTWVSLQKDLSGGEKAYNRIDNNGDLYQAVSMAWPNNKKAPDDYFIPLIHPITKNECPVPPKGWRNPSSTMRELLESDLIVFGTDETTQPRRKYLLKENIYENIPSVLYYGGSDTDMLSEMEIPFDTPKVVNIVAEHLLSFTRDGDIVMDFFSGSATTAHAVMQLNAESKDGSRRKFLMVQLAEDLDKNYESASSDEKTVIKRSIDFLDTISKPHFITEIGKERIRRAGEKIKQEIEAANAQLKIGEKPKQVPDIGFKVFRTADTNIKWNLYDALGQLDTSAMTHTPDLADFTMGFSDIDVVYEVMLRQKDVPLSSTLETLTDIGSRTYLYGSAYLVCRETEITENLIDKLAALDPLPIKFIFRDSAFKDDINLKDETFRRLKNLIERNSGLAKKTYTVEFI